MAPGLLRGDTSTADVAFHQQGPVLCVLTGPWGAWGTDSPVPERIRAGTLQVPCSGAPCFQQGGLGSDVAVLSQPCMDMLERN